MFFIFEYSVQVWWSSGHNSTRSGKNLSLIWQDLMFAIQKSQCLAKLWCLLIISLSRSDADLIFFSQNLNASFITIHKRPHPRHFFDDLSKGESDVAAFFLIISLCPRHTLNESALSCYTVDVGPGNVEWEWKLFTPFITVSALEQAFLWWEAQQPPLLPFFFLPRVSNLKWRLISFLRRRAEFSAVENDWNIFIRLVGAEKFSMSSLTRWSGGRSKPIKRYIAKAGLLINHRRWACVWSAPVFSCGSSRLVSLSSSFV